MLALATALLLLVHLASPPTVGLWTQTFANSLHVPIFAIISLCIFVVTGTIGNATLSRRIGIAISVTFLLGVLSEAAQIPGPRHASLEDLRSDWLGATAMVLLAVAAGRTNPISRGVRSISAITGISLLLLALSPLIQVSAAYLERNYQFPTIVSFDSYFGGRFILSQHTDLRVSRSATDGRKIADIELREGAWPAIIIHDVRPDWRAFSTLVIDFGLAGDIPLDINVRVHDRKHQHGKQLHSDRFNLQYELQPGNHTLRVPLGQISRAPATRQMDMSQVDGIVLFCSAKDVGRSFRLLSIRLE